MLWTPLWRRSVRCPIVPLRALLLRSKPLATNRSTSALHFLCLPDSTLLFLLAYSVVRASLCLPHFRFLTAERQSRTWVRSASCRHTFASSSEWLLLTQFACPIVRASHLMSTHSHLPLDLLSPPTYHPSSPCHFFFFLLIPAGLLSPLMIPLPVLTAMTFRAAATTLFSVFGFCLS